MVGSDSSVDGGSSGALCHRNITAHAMFPLADWLCCVVHNKTAFTEPSAHSQMVRLALKHGAVGPQPTGEVCAEKMSAHQGCTQDFLRAGGGGSRNLHSSYTYRGQ